MLLWTENCVSNRLKSSALSVLIWTIHMDNLNLCKANLESLILSLAEKYLPQLNLVMTVPGIQSFATIDIISEIGVDMSVFPTSKQLCSRTVLRRRTTRAQERRKPPELAELELTSSLNSFSTSCAQSARKAIWKSAYAMRI